MKSVQKFLTYIDSLPPRTLVIRAVYATAVAAAVAALCASLVMRKILTDIPSVDKLDEYTPPLTTYIYDVNDRVIAEFSEEKRAMLPLSSIPLDLQNAAIAMEDKNFFKHWGISPKGMARALLRDIIHIRMAQGGSTITQQLSRNIFLHREKTLLRKIKEMVLALQIERNFSKQEILQMYFNQVYLGSVYGVQSAAELYFGKNVQELNLAECALLVGILPNPGRFSPFSNPEKAKLRRYLVLKSMVDERYITQKEMDAANKEPIPTERATLFASHAPYFVEYIRKQLAPKYGVARLWKDGLKIYTTLDLSMQVPAEEIMENDPSSLHLAL